MLETLNLIISNFRFIYIPISSSKLFPFKSLMKSPYMNKILNIGLTSVLAIFIVGCSKSTYNSFQDKVAAYAKDQVITQQEYEDLANYLKNNDESWAANIKDKQGKVNN